MTPLASRIQIVIVGLPNVGKSSFINKLTNQTISITSPIAGTTTDPVHKAMEIMPLGPVNIIDTAGYEDNSTLGQLRQESSDKALREADIILLIIDATKSCDESLRKLISKICSQNKPFVLLLNKTDLVTPSTIGKLEHQLSTICDAPIINISATKDNSRELIEKLLPYLPKTQPQTIVSQFINPGDFILVIIPIDKSAPVGRLILPQQQILREINDAGAIAVVTPPTKLEQVLKNLQQPPTLAITDSQVFKYIHQLIPPTIKLTSFSILFANFKGNLAKQVSAARHLRQLPDNANILIAEGCTHHIQCDDIGRVKLPKWIREYTNKDINFSFSSGKDFPKNLSSYDLIIHCGGCMLSTQEMKYRIQQAEEQSIPITNYGMVIAEVNGILDRSLEIFE